MTNLVTVFKSRDITLPTKVHLVKATVFPVVMYGCESWSKKKAECQRIDAFELWWRLLRIPWTARKSNHSILKEIISEYSLWRLMLKLQYFGHLTWIDSFEKTLRLGKTEGRRRRGRQSMRWLDGITNSMDMDLWTPGVGDGQGGLVCCNSWGRKESDMTEQLKWIELNLDFIPLDLSIYTMLISRVRLPPKAAEWFKHICDASISYTPKILMLLLAKKIWGMIYFSKPEH